MWRLETRQIITVGAGTVVILRCTVVNSYGE
ncbi:hypothetical protein E2320_012364, partial [Naja naja]